MQASPEQASPPPAPSGGRSFAAFRYPAFRAQFTTFVIAMMADNVEHVISYWMVFQKFQSPALGGFAVLSHWLPFLLFSVATGALADRFDSRKIIQCGMALFSLVSLAWGYFFFTDTLQVWHAMVLLALHGLAGVLWVTPNQLLLYDIATSRTVQISPEAFNVSYRSGIVWWSTGNQDAFLRHSLDLRTL